MAGNAAVHFVIEAAEPNGPLRVARTYFFSMPPPCLLWCVGRLVCELAAHSLILAYAIKFQSPLHPEHLGLRAVSVLAS